MLCQLSCNMVLSLFQSTDFVVSSNPGNRSLIIIYMFHFDQCLQRAEIRDLGEEAIITVVKYLYVQPNWKDLNNNKWEYAPFFSLKHSQNLLRSVSNNILLQIQVQAD